MKTTLRYIATRKVAKWVPRTQAVELFSFLKEQGWERNGATMTMGHHAFHFAGHGAKVAVSYKKREVASA
jgi:hypothetical protein